MNDITAVDLVLLIAIGVSAVVGLVRGLIREVLSLVVWTGAALIAFAYAGRVATRLEPWLGQEDVRTVAAFAILFFGVLIAGGLFSWLAAKAIASSGLSFVDRLLGFAFGGLRGGVLCIAAIVMLRPFVSDSAGWRSSRVIERLEPFEALVLQLFDDTAGFVRAVSDEL